MENLSSLGDGLLKELFQQKIYRRIDNFLLTKSSKESIVAKRTSWIFGCHSSLSSVQNKISGQQLRKRLSGEISTIPAVKWSRVKFKQS